MNTGEAHRELIKLCPELDARMSRRTAVRRILRALAVDRYNEGFADSLAIVVDGMIMTPLIVDAAAFDRKTAELRDAGFINEDDARDRFAHKRH